LSGSGISAILRAFLLNGESVLYDLTTRNVGVERD
jgi:hypothetical protein